MRTVLLADRLIDGTGGPTIDEPVVLISDGLITGVHQGHAREYIDSPGVEVLDYRGCTLWPGWIDAHVHTNLPGDGTSFEMTMAHDDGVLVASSMNAARIALESGITTVRDVGGRGQTTFDARTALRAGYGYGPRMLLAGQPMTITGGHCWYFGGEADGVDGVRAKVRELAKAGADWIKVIDSGGGTPNTLSHKPSFRP